MFSHACCCYSFFFTEVDSVLSRMQIIGVILCFRLLAQEALTDVLDNRIPYLMSSIADFKHHVPNGDTMVSVDTVKHLYCS